MKKTKPTNFSALAKKIRFDPTFNQLAKHYPYTEQTVYHGGLFGTVNLLRPGKWWFTKCQTRDALISNIMQEVGAAMHYVVVYHPENWFERQAIEAFSMFQLLKYGHHINQAIEDIPKPLEVTALADAQKTIHKDKKTYGKMYMKSAMFIYGNEPEKLAELYLKNWSNSGRYLVTHKTINEMTMPQLRAIKVIVDDSFENMC